MSFSRSTWLLEIIRFMVTNFNHISCTSQLITTIREFNNNYWVRWIFISSVKEFTFSFQLGLNTKTGIQIDKYINILSFLWDLVAPCGSEFTRQGILLPLDNHSYYRCSSGLQSTASYININNLFWPSDTEQASAPINLIINFQKPVLLISSRLDHFSATLQGIFYSEVTKQNGRVP